MLATQWHAPFTSAGLLRRGGGLAADATLPRLSGDPSQPDRPRRGASFARGVVSGLSAGLHRKPRASLAARVYLLMVVTTG